MFTHATTLLEQALLSQRWLAYMAYRLRYYACLVVLQTLLFAGTVPQIWRSVDGVALQIFLSCLVIMALLHGFWWGVLETMRQQIRATPLYRKHQYSLIVAQWLRPLVILWLAVTSLGAAWLCAHWLAFGWVSYQQGIAVTCASLTIAQLISLTYHNGIYARRRIFRPLLWLILPTAGAMGWIIWGSSLGAWSLLAALLTGSACVMLGTYLYTGRLYRRYRVRPLHALLHVNGWPMITRRSLLAGFASLLYRSDSLLILLLALWLFNHPIDSMLQMMVGVFTIAPLFKSAHDWAQLTYFDQQRLARLGEPLLLTRLQNGIRRSAIAMAIILVIVALGIMLWHRTPLDFLVIALGLLATRALVAPTQIAMFTRGQYGHLIALNSFMIIILAGLTYAALAVALWPAYTVLAIAQLLWLSAQLRKTWHPRYGVLSPWAFKAMLQQQASSAIWRIQVSQDTAAAAAALAALGLVTAQGNIIYLQPQHTAQVPQRVNTTLLGLAVSCTPIAITAAIAAITARLPKTDDQRWLKIPLQQQAELPQYWLAAWLHWCEGHQQKPPPVFVSRDGAVPYLQLRRQRQKIFTPLPNTAILTNGKSA